MKTKQTLAQRKESRRICRLNALLKKDPKNRTWLVPDNPLGISALHNVSNVPMRPTDARKVFKVFAAIEPDYQAEISKTADWKKCMAKFDLLKLMLVLCPDPLPERTKIFVIV